MNRIVLVFLTLSLAACDWFSAPSRGFSLPEGDSAKGEFAFIGYGCIDCHHVKDLKVPADHTYLFDSPILLGGENTGVRSYGELVTSIINPSHKLTPRLPVSQTADQNGSKMVNVNDSLTVSDLIDLVAYLQPKFNVKPDRISKYRLYRLRQKPQAAQEG